MNKIANDPNAPQGEKSAAKKKMSEFESKYQEIISKYKTVPSAPAKPAPVNPPPATATAPVVPKPAAAPVVATPPTPQPAPPTAPVAPAGGGRIPPPPTPPRPSSPPADPSNNKPRGIPNPKQPQQQQRAPRPYNLGGLQQQWQQMGLGPSAKANALPRGPKQQGMLSKIAQAPFKALQKGVGAYSAITNAPRALGQSLKAAAGGDPYRLQQQIGSIPRAIGLPAVQVKTQQDKLQNLTNQLSQQPTNQQLVQQIQQLQKQINTMQQNAQRIK